MPWLAKKKGRKERPIELPHFLYLKMLTTPIIYELSCGSLRTVLHKQNEEKHYPGKSKKGLSVIVNPWKIWMYGCNYPGENSCAHYLSLLNPAVIFMEL